MSKLTRREFARAAAAAAAGATLLPRRIHSAEPSSAPPQPAPPAPAKKLSPAGQAESDARMKMIVARYGARLSEAQRSELQRMSADAQLLLEAVRAFPLDYSDEPAHIFLAPRKHR
jgi:hypothetical protein